VKLKISDADYAIIANSVREQIKSLPGYDCILPEELRLGPEFLANNLRISTPKTSVKFTPQEQNHLNLVREQIRKENRPNAKERLQQLDSIVLFGQLLFSQAGCLAFLDKFQCDEESGFYADIANLKKLANAGGVEIETISKREVLSQRKTFSQTIKNLMLKLARSPLSDQQKRLFESDLFKAQGFYFQLNDLNFTYANAPSRRYSNFVNAIELQGSRVALGASIVAIFATALSFIPVLAPVALPVAAIASLTALCIGMPLSMKKVVTMIYNGIKYDAAPTKGELINATLFGLCLLAAGTGGIINSAINTNLLGKFAFLVTKLVKAGKNLGQASLGAFGQVIKNNQQKNIHAFFQIKEEHKNPREVEMSELPKLGI
jgi:hypothetical protein